MSDLEWRAADRSDTQPAGDLERLRRLLAACRRGPTPCSTFAARPGLAWRRVRCHPGGLPRGVTVVCLVPAPAPGARPVLTPVHVTLASRPAGSPSRWLVGIALEAARVLRSQPADQGLVGRLRARERALLAHAVAERARVASRWQGSLFEQRTARIVRAARADADARIAAHQQRLEALEENAGTSQAMAVVALLVD